MGCVWGMQQVLWPWEKSENEAVQQPITSKRRERLLASRSLRRDEKLQSKVMSR